MKIYLAGKIPKGDEIGKAPDWRADYSKELTVINNCEILSPENSPLDESNSLLVFGHDCFFVKEADIIIVNASAKLGVGTAQEMLIAKYFNKPVITVLPKDSHHRRTNLVMPAAVVPDWIHPFIFSTSDFIAEDLPMAITWLKNYSLKTADYKIKGIDVIDNAIEKYIDWNKKNT